MPNTHGAPQTPLEPGQIKLLLFISTQCDEAGMLSEKGQQAVMGEASSDRAQIRYLYNRGLIDAKLLLGEAGVPLGLTPEGQSVVAELRSRK